MEWGRGTFRVRANRKGLRWYLCRVLTGLHNCVFFEGKGLKLKWGGGG